MNCAVGSGKSKSSAKRMKLVEGMSRADRLALERSVPFHIDNYFRGMDVPPGVDITSPRYVNLCITTGICEAADEAYRAMSEAGRFRSSTEDGTVGEDVMLVIRILRGIRRKCVPQEISAGIMLMHLEILEGLKFSTAT